MKKILTVNFFIILIIIIFLEFIVNIFKLSNLKGIEPGLINTSNKIHKMYPNVSGTHYGKKIFIDNNGFRVPYKDYNYDNSNNSIFIIGDSTAFGNGVNEENTFVGKLRKKFKNKNFYNTAVPGYNIRHFQNNLDEIEKFKNVKKVFYFITLNDIYGGVSIINLSKNKSTLKNIEHKKTLFEKINIINKLNAFLNSHSYLYIYLKGITTDPSKRYFMNILNNYSNNKLSEMKNYLTKLKNQTKNNNIQLKIIILPYEYQTRNCEKKDLIPQYMISKILLSLKIDFSDYTSNFCENINPNSLFYKFDPMHLSTKGHSLVFDLIKNEI
jgi:hypothetical protein